MKKIAILVFVLASLLVVPSAFALVAPDLTYYPTKVTADAGFLAVADPHPGVNDVIRVEWLKSAGVGGTGALMGLFPKIGNQWICYFSNSDQNSTCGPSPFTTTTAFGGEWSLQLTSINQDEDSATQSHVVEVGGIDLTPSSTTIDTNDETVDVIICPREVETGLGKLVNSINYHVYKSDMTDTGISGTIDFDAGIGCNVGTIDTGLGIFFITFDGEESGAGTDFGGVAINVSVTRTSGIGPSGYVIDAETIIKSLGFTLPGQSFTGTGNLTNLGENNLTNITVNTSLYESQLNITVNPTNNGILEPDESTTFSYTVGNIASNEGLYLNTWFDIHSNVTVDGTVIDENEKVGEVIMKLSVSYGGGTSENPCTGLGDGSSCPGGQCVKETCIAGGFDCISDDQCSAGEACQGLMCVSAGGCPSGSSCYAGTSSAACTGSTTAIIPIVSCLTGTDEPGICCIAVECIDDDQCSGSTPFCYNNQCVECTTNDDCTGEEVCQDNQCQSQQATICPSGSECRTECYAGETQTGYWCDISAPGALDGMCCESGSTPDEEGDMTLIFIIAVVVIIGAGAYYYFKKYKKSGGRGRGGKRKKMSEEEDLEKELEEEF